MKFAVAFLLAQALEAGEPLPVDEALAAYETVVPELRSHEARINAETGTLGAAEPDFGRSGMTPEAAITAGSGNVADHVLGEWEVGGHGVVIPGDRPFEIPATLYRYSVRQYSGPIDYHTYHRAERGIVFHTFGTIQRIGNAECQTTRGISVISREAWRDWPAQTAVALFSAARMTRDDSRTYCILYRPTENGRFSQLAYTPEGEPYVSTNQDAQAFVVTSRVEAISRIFD